jgi:hypothetical protein
MAAYHISSLWIAVEPDGKAAMLAGINSESAHAKKNFGIGAQ